MFCLCVGRLLCGARPIFVSTYASAFSEMRLDEYKTNKYVHSIFATLSHCLHNDASTEQLLNFCFINLYVMVLLKLPRMADCHHKRSKSTGHLI